MDSRAKPAVGCRIRLTHDGPTDWFAPDISCDRLSSLWVRLQWVLQRAAKQIGAARKGTDMALVIILLLLALLLGGLGFAVHVLWWIAIAVFVVFLVSLVLNRR